MNERVAEIRARTRAGSFRRSRRADVPDVVTSLVRMRLDGWRARAVIEREWRTSSPGPPGVPAEPSAEQELVPRRRAAPAGLLHADGTSSHRGSRA